MTLNKLVNKHQSIIEDNGWSDTISIFFHKEGSKGELRDAARDATELTRSIAVEFASWYQSKQTSYKEWIRDYLMNQGGNKEDVVKAAFVHWLNNVYEG